jgi:hypothetical protein
MNREWLVGSHLEAIPGGEADYQTGDLGYPGQHVGLGCVRGSVNIWGAHQLRGIYR